MSDPEEIRMLFMWMTIINVAILIFSAVMLMCFKSTVYRLHGLVFEIDRDRIAEISYNHLGNYRLMVIVFNIVPYLALTIMY